MTPRCAVAVLSLTVAAVGCRREAPRQQVSIESSRPSPVGASEPEVSAIAVMPTPCGEPGPTPTDVPTLVRTGGTMVGEGPLKAEQSVAWGPVELAYVPDAMIGTRRAFTRGPVIEVEMDRALAGDGPWGTKVRVDSGRPTQGELGPFRIFVRPSGSDDPPPVEVTVIRRVCQRTSDWPLPNTGKTWAWLSPDGITQHNVDNGEQTIYVNLSLLPMGDSRLSVRHQHGSVALALREETTPMTHAVGFRVGVDEVLPASGTTWVDGALAAENDTRPQAHVRFWIERVAMPPSKPAPEGTPEPCGRPHARVATRPPRLDGPPRSVGRADLADGSSARLGGRTVSLTEGRDDSQRTIYERHRPSRWFDLIVRGRDAVSLQHRIFDRRDIMQVRRVEELLLLAEPIGTADPLPTRLRLRAFELACPMRVEAPLSPKPQALWLSTRGLLEVALKPSGDSQLRFTLHEEFGRARVTVAWQGEHGENNDYDSAVRPDSVGHSWEVLDRRVTLAAVETGPHTRWVDDRLEADDDLPAAVHVRFDVEPTK